jgi:hypothetical protein
MSTIEIRKGLQVSLDDLVTSLSKMDMSELKNFADKMNHLVDLRHDTASDEAEREVIQQIKDIIPASVVRRFKQLKKKQDAGTLTPKEQEETILLTDFMEEKSTERVFLIGLLAKKRNISVAELIKQFPLIRYE